MAKRGMTIAAAAKAVKASPPTLRFYEKLGLLKTARGPGGFRLYGDNELARLRFIRQMREVLCFSLAEIKDILDLTGRREGFIKLKEILERHEADLEARILGLKECKRRLELALKELERRGEDGQDVSMGIEIILEAGME